MKKTILLAVIVSFFASCKEESKDQASIKTEVQTFLDEYTTTYKQLYYDSAEAEWAANTRIVAGDTTNAYNVQKAGEAYAKFTGSVDVIEKTKKFLESKDELDTVQVRQLNTILYNAANNPETVSELVKERIAAENAQSETLFGFDLKWTENPLPRAVLMLF